MISERKRDDTKKLVQIKQHVNKYKPTYKAKVSNKNVKNDPKIPFKRAGNTATENYGCQDGLIDKGNTSFCLF